MGSGRESRLRSRLFWRPYQQRAFTCNGSGGNINNIDAEVNNKLDKTNGQLVGNEMKNDTKHYVESINHDINWLKKITI